MTTHERNRGRALLATALFSAATLLAPAAVAQDRSGVGDADAWQLLERWDENRDREVSREEFDEGMIRAGTFEELDRDQNRSLDESELKSGVFRYLDGNDDGTLEPQEFREGWDRWFPSEPPEIEAIDADGDGVIDEREFENAGIDLGIYGAQPTDEGPYVVTEEEFYAGIYESWDKDDDRSALAEDEWYRSDEPFPLGTGDR